MEIYKDSRGQIEFYECPECEGQRMVAYKKPAVNKVELCCPDCDYNESLFAPVPVQLAGKNQGKFLGSLKGGMGL